MQDIIKLSAYELALALAKRELTSEEITKAFIEQANKVEDKINSYIVQESETALKVAKRVDKFVQEGKERAPLEEAASWEAKRIACKVNHIGLDSEDKLHPLAGVPLAVKDVVVTKNVQTTAGSKLLEGWLPPYDATLVDKLKLAGMPILGKTNMDEFAMGSSTEHSAYGKTFNPFGVALNEELIPGGSGGGSAAVVASYEAPLAIGTDTGGSIRQPAAVTGTVGVKPTYGFVSRYGLIAMSSSLDQAGPCSKTVVDSALLQDVIQGFDERDSTSLNIDYKSNYQAAVKGKEEGIKGLRVGIISELNGSTEQGFSEGVSKAFQSAVEQFKKQGALVEEINCPSFKYALGAYYLIMPSEASSNLAKFDGMRYGKRVDKETTEKMMKATRGELLGSEVKRRIILGTYALSSGYYDAYYGSAQKIRTMIQQDFAEAFKKFDVLISPTAPSVAFKIGEKLDDPLAMYLNDIATIPVNLAGVPAISVPNGAAEKGLPSGLQIIAPAFQDSLLYKVAAAIEDELPKVELSSDLSSFEEVGVK